MNTELNKKLETVRDILASYPTAHVGGSIGLYLQGIDLGRNFETSDIDIIMPKRPSDGTDIAEKDLSNSGFDFTLELLEGGKTPIAEIAIDPDAEFRTVPYEGHEYRVTDWCYIVSRKAYYASKGNQKQRHDMCNMITVNVNELPTGMHEWDL
jgi:hypothetical protein